MWVELRFQLQLTPGKSKFSNVPGVVPGGIFSSRKENSLVAQPVSKALLPSSRDGNSQVNPNHSSSLWIPNYWWAEFCHCTYACVYVYTHRVHRYFSEHTRKNLLPPLLPPPLPKFWGIWGATQTQSGKSQCMLPMLHLCRTHCKPVDVLRVVWEGDLLERKSAE